MTRIAKRPTPVTNGMCEHGCCDHCPQGCFDHYSELDYEELQRKLQARQFCIGWHPVDSQKRTYYPALYDSWHEANQIAKDMQSDDPTHVFFVEPVTKTQTCGKCNGTGKDEDNDWCGHCHGKGKVRDG